MNNPARLEDRRQITRGPKLDEGHEIRDALAHRWKADATVLDDRKLLDDENRRLVGARGKRRDIVESIAHDG